MPIENDDIILNKIAVMQRAIKRALEEFNKNQSLSNYTEVDALILNLERACQAAIDLGMHLISKNKLGCLNQVPMRSVSWSQIRLFLQPLQNH
ncbi:DUF86 domain-containing protein [Leptospira levettii]|nr:HepT-like ribonuclease domain-containing protein [Leptospira levettii]MCW7472008.1 DUF86 domain-containing protein [Leptospira levettii]